ncbi:MAG: hypothetical protein B6243_10370, partial [Anaerolineaceae bacterium 4572_5.2]
ARVITDVHSDLVKTSDFNELKEIVKDIAYEQRELASAQKRTELKIEELAEGQKELAYAQTRTELRVEELAKAQTSTAKLVKQLARHVGGLSDTIGGDVEDISYSVIPYVLEQELGWKVGPLERVWHTWGKEAEEVDVFGQATDPTRPDETIWIVGEAKINLTFKEAGKFIQQLTRARQNLKGEIFPVCFCYRARPEVRQLLSEANIRLIFSYGKLV